MMRIGFTLLCLIGWTCVLIGQELVVEGKVTYVSGSNVYVRFLTTSKIELQDTLYRREGNTYIPCLRVVNKSSSSTVNEILNDYKAVTNESIYYVKDKVEKLEQPIEVKPKENLEVVEVLPVVPDASDEEEARKGKHIVGRISAATYSNFSSIEGADRHRTMLRASVNANQIGGSDFSFESYVNYRKNIVKTLPYIGYRTSFLNIYNLAMVYQIDTLSWVAIGRKINRNASSIGPVDGLMGEKNLGKFYVGGIVGFRPDIVDFGFNTNLRQYGAYVGWQQAVLGRFSQTTLGLLQQNNMSKVDRRYTYFQHTSQPISNLYLFSSIEMDLYQKLNEVETFSPRLTNLFASARYRFSRKLSLTVSYDSRRRVIFYESLRTDIEELLADDQARQGLRFRVNFAPIKYLTGGVSYNKRYQEDGQNKADNYNGYIGYGKVPGIGGRLSLTFNHNVSNYLTSNIYSIQYSQSMLKKKLNMDMYFRNVSYIYGVGETRSSQSFYGLSLSTRISKTMNLHVLSEYAIRQDQSNIRINTRINKRF